jgi:hypothetical protein
VETLIASGAKIEVRQAVLARCQPMSVLIASYSRGESNMRLVDSEHAKSIPSQRCVCVCVKR